MKDIDGLTPNELNHHYKMILDWYNSVISNYKHRNFNNSDAIWEELRLLIVDMPDCYEKLYKTNQQLQVENEELKQNILKLKGDK